MSITKTSVLAVAALVCGSGASAEGLLAEHMVQALDAGPWAHASSPRWLTAQAADGTPFAYLAGAAAGARAQAKAAEAAALAPLPDADAPAALIDALDKLGPMDVGIADYLAIAWPSLAAGPADAGKALEAGRSRGSPVGQRSAMSFMPEAGADTPPRPAAPARARWSLPTALPQQLTRYLFLAAVAALLAGGLLRLAPWTRRSAAPSLAR